jgi:hypothetical protein
VIRVAAVVAKSDWVRDRCRDGMVVSGDGERSPPTGKTYTCAQKSRAPS